MEQQNDSTVTTLTHIRKVNSFLIDFATEILNRAKVHDESKLHEPEKSVFDKYSSLLYATIYNSPEYHQYLDEMRPAIEHHEANNSHHPGYYPHGVDDMDLFDIVEMFCDWRAASQRTQNGSFWNSIKVNKDRFHISHQLHSIFANTYNNIPDGDCREIESYTNQG